MLDFYHVMLFWTSFAYEIILDLPDNIKTKHKRIIVYCGVHKSFGLHWLRPGYKIAFNVTISMMKMATMRTSKSPSAIEKVAYALSKADIFLDLNGTNRPYYEANIEQETKAQIHFVLIFFHARFFIISPITKKNLYSLVVKKVKDTQNTWQK